MASSSPINTLHIERGHFNRCVVDLTVPTKHISHKSNEDPRKAQHEKATGGEEEREDWFTLIL